MKILLILTLAILSTTAFAESICYVPKDCEIIDTDLSFDPYIFKMTVDCRNEQGITKYINKERAPRKPKNSFFSDLEYPVKIVFKKHDRDILHCEY